ncbi:maleylpyruvate isomerase N-terminal domain-containing protein [Streptomyces sp. NPDC048419]|uniref:maleylpyruvate isomerase N-terminal domain-containing protein n=1 Tax=Streptomyces sp. NPDC048419 TaxID=3365547 RepID=UPI003723CA85
MAGLDRPSGNRQTSAVRAARLRIADLLEDLVPDEWEQESFSRGWRVRDVAGHLALVPTITTWDMVAVAPRARFSPDRINTVLARRHGSRDIRAHEKRSI